MLYFQKSVNSFSSSTSFPNQKLVSRFPPPLIQSSHSQVLPKSKVDIWNHRSSRMKKLVKVGISFDAERQSRFVLTQTRSRQIPLSHPQSKSWYFLLQCAVHRNQKSVSPFCAKVSLRQKSVFLVAQEQKFVLTRWKLVRPQSHDNS